MSKLIKTAFLCLLILGSSSLLNSQTPAPQAAFGVYLNGNSITVKDLITQKSINVLCPPCDSSLQFTVTSHRIITVPAKGNPTVSNSTKNSIPKFSYDAIALLKSGDRVIVEAIVAQATQFDKVVNDSMRMSPMILTVR